MLANAVPSLWQHVSTTGKKVVAIVAVAALGTAVCFGYCWALHADQTPAAGGSTPTAPAAEVPTGLLWPQAPNAGLTVTTSGATATHRIDPFVGASVLSPDEPTIYGLIPPPSKRDPDLLPLAPPASGAGRPRVRWEGEVYAEGGEYEMNLRTDAHALLLVDGAPVLKVCASPPPGDIPIRGGDSGTGARVSMSPGWHRVRVDLDATGDANGLEWSWTRPDGVSEIVPPSRLRYVPDVPANGVTKP